MGDIGLVVSDGDAPKKNVEGTVIKEFFTTQCPNLGLAVAQINRMYPPKHQWACNQEVDEMYYVLQGKGNITLEGHGKFELNAGTAVFIPKGTRYRVQGTLKMVVPTSPAWYMDQHKWSS